MKKEKRTNMKPEERRKQLLDCAQNLFFTKGFEETTMQDILAAADVSKGGFYHHFKSKDELLEGVLRRFSNETEATLEPILEKDHDDWLALYEHYFETLRRQLADGERGRLPLLLVLFKDENAALRQRLMDSTHEANTRNFTQVLQRGIRCGALDLPDAEVAARLAIRVGTSHQELIKKAFKAKNRTELSTIAHQIHHSVMLQGLTIDRMLGLPDGTTKLREEGFADKMAAGIAETIFDREMVQ